MTANRAAIAKARIARAVACVNGCRGIDDPGVAVSILWEVCKQSLAYYEMLERATGVEHGVLAILRAAIAKATPAEVSP